MILPLQNTSLFVQAAFFEVSSHGKPFTKDSLHILVHPLDYCQSSREAGAHRPAQPDVRCDDHRGKVCFRPV
jgi:hypothetical protein